MPSYHVFGVRMDCPFELPELETSDVAGSADWRIDACSGTPRGISQPATGADTVYGSVQVRSFVSPEMVRLAFDDTGIFDVHPGRVIQWYPGVEGNAAAVRADLLGRVLATAMHLDGALVLHASAVSIDGNVIAFLGPKHAGKSTLAMALVRRGARLVTDDTLVVWFRGDAAIAVPGIQRVRLWPDSARAIGVTATSGQGAKPTIDALGADSREQVEKPLGACYVVQPVGGSHGLVRRQLSGVQAALTGVSFSKLAALAGGRLGIEVLERSTRLARLTPVYAAEVPRDLHQLDRVANAVAQWHGASTPNAAGVS